MNYAIEIFCQKLGRPGITGTLISRSGADDNRDRNSKKSVNLGGKCVSVIRAFVKLKLKCN